MNLLSLEDKFKQLDQREKEVRSYFDPRSKSKKKHHYITDIRADFQYDNLLYGMGTYINVEEEAEPLPKTPQSEQPAVVAEVVTVSPKKSNLAKRRQPEVLEVREPISKDKYVGAFAHTKIIKPELVGKKSEPKPLPQIWRSNVDDSTNVVSNPAATEEIRYSKAPQAKNLRQIQERLKQAYVDERPKRFVKDNTLLSNESVGLTSEAKLQDLSLSVPEAPSYLLAETQFEDETCSLKVEMIKRADHEWEVFREGKLHNVYQSESQSQSPIDAVSERGDSSLEFRPGYFMLQIKLTNIQQRLHFHDFTAIFTDITDLRYPQHTHSGLSVDDEGFTWFGNSTYFDPLKHFELVRDKELVSHTLRVQLIGCGAHSECLIDRFVHFGSHSEDQDNKVADEIQRYEAFLLSLRDEEEKSRSQKLLAEAQNLSLPGRSVFRYLKEKLDMKQPEVQRLDRLPTIRSERLKDSITTKRVTPHSLQKGPQPKPRKSSASMGGGFKSGNKTLGKAEDTRSSSPSKNPMTSALYKFREDSTAFRPNTYSANLQIYQEFDMLESKYPAAVKAKQPAEPTQVVFLLSGQAVGRGT
jgi:hypothetical protein